MRIHYLQLIALACVLSLLVPDFSRAENPVDDALWGRVLRAEPRAEQHLQTLQASLARLAKIYLEFTKLPHPQEAPHSGAAANNIYFDVWYSLLESWLQRPEREADFLAGAGCRDWATRFADALEQTRSDASRFIVSIHLGYIDMDALPDPILAAANYTRGLRYGWLAKDHLDRPGHFFSPKGEKLSAEAVFHSFKCAKRLLEASVAYFAAQ